MVRGTSRHLPRILLQTYGGRQWTSELDVRSDAYCARPPRSAASGPPHEPQSPYTPHRRPRSRSPLPMKTARPPALRPATEKHSQLNTSPANSLPREHQPRPYRSGPPFAPRTTHPPCRVGVARHRRPRGRDRDPIPTILAPAAAGHCSCHSARLAQSVSTPSLAFKLLFHQPPEGAGRQALLQRVASILAGNWEHLLTAAHQARRGPRPPPPEAPALEDAAAVGRRERGQICQGDRARATLTAAPLAPGTQATLDALSDPARRPPNPLRPLPDNLPYFAPPLPLLLILLYVSIHNAFMHVDMYT